MYQPPELGLKPLCMFPEQITEKTEECEVHGWLNSEIWQEVLGWIEEPRKHNTLTEMLVNSDTHFHPDQLIAAKEVFKEWLKQVGLPPHPLGEITRQLLVTLVDEP